MSVSYIDKLRASGVARPSVPNGASGRMLYSVDASVRWRRRSAARCRRASQRPAIPPECPDGDDGDPLRDDQRFTGTGRGGRDVILNVYGNVYADDLQEIVRGALRSAPYQGQY